MPFDPALLEEEDSGFDPSLLEPDQDTGVSEEEAAKILEQPGVPSWITDSGLRADQPDTGTLRAPTIKERIRSSPIAQKLFGPEVPPLVQGQAPAIVPVAEKMLEFTSPPPPVQEAIQTITNPFIEALPEGAAQGVAEGLRNTAMQLPLAPFGPATKVAMPIFAGEFALQVPEARKAYQDALARGDSREAALQAAQFVANSLLMAAGTAHAATTGKPNARPNIETAEIHGDVRPQPEQGVREVPVEEGRGGVQPSAETQAPSQPAEAKAGSLPLINDPEGITGPAIHDFVGDQVSSLPEQYRPEKITVKSKGEAGFEDNPFYFSSKDGETVLNWDALNRKMEQIVADTKERGGSIEEGHAEQEKYIRTALGEEGIHQYQTQKVSIPEAAAVYDNMPEFAKSLLRKSYGEVSGENASAQYGHEYLRRVAQWAMGKPHTELVGKYGTKWMSEKAIDLTLRTVHEIRKRLPTEGGRELKATLDKMENRLNVAKEINQRREDDGVKLGSQKIEPGKLEDFKDELPKAPHFPVLIERPDGTRYEAYMNGYYELPGRPPWMSIGKVMPSGAEMKPSLSHGMLAPDEKIVGGNYPKTPEEYRAAESSGEKPPRTLAQLPEAPQGSVKLGSPSLRGAAKKSWDELNRIRRALPTMFRGRPNADTMSGRMDAADNAANIHAKQVRNSLNIGNDNAVDQGAAAAIIESGFDRERLGEFLRQARAGNNPEAVRVVERALSDYNRLEGLARRGNDALNDQLREENGAGINTENRDNYVPHVYDKDLWMGQGRPFVIGGSGTGLGSGFKKGRTFDTIFDAIEAGYEPKSLRLDDLVEHRVGAGQRLINRRHWADGLKQINDPTDGKPLVADLIRKQRGPGGTFYEVAPAGYVPREIMPGVRIAVHEAYRPVFDALTGTSAIASSTPGKLLLEGIGAIKHGLLGFDTFHAMRVLFKKLALTGKTTYGKGLSLLEYADRDLGLAVRDGLISQETADWVRQNRPEANLGIQEGLNVGRIAEALYTSVVRDIPGLGTFNKWVFEKLTRGAMMEAFIHEYNRLKTGEGPDPATARKVAKNINEYFGNLGRQGFFKSRTMQDMARIIALAPQWVEGMARSEAKGYGQLAKAPVDLATGKEFKVGVLGKAMATGLFATFVATQLLNLATRRKPTWENDEEGHKMDAFIPAAGKGQGFWFSPFAIPAEITHDMIKYSKSDDSSLKAAAHILSNKAAPITRAAASLGLGKSFWNDPKTDETWGRVKKAMTSLNPTPIPLQPLQTKTVPGALQRQLMASAGIRTEAAETPVQQIADKARQFLKKEGIKIPTIEQTEDPSYSRLRNAVRREDYDEARRITEELQKTRKGQVIFKAMKANVLHPFTNGVKEEKKFRQGLNEKEKNLYKQAIDQRREEFRRFVDNVWTTRKKLSGITNAQPSGFDPALLVPE